MELLCSKKHGQLAVKEANIEMLLVFINMREYVC
jgi:hypothetical protein